MIDLSVIILNYNMKGLVKQCVRGIAANTPPCSTEVIVVDNASIDGSTPIFDEWERTQPFPSITFRFLPRATNDGYAVGNNEGVRIAQGSVVLILNPDIAVLKGSIELLLEYLNKHPNVAVVGPKLLNPDKSIQYSCFRFPTLMTPLYRRTILSQWPTGKQHLKEYMMTDWDHESTRRVDWIMGSAMVLRKNAIEHVGGLDEQFFMYYEDIDWCRRFWQSGYEIHYVPHAQMVHYHQRLSAQTSVVKNLSSWATRTHIRSAIHYYLKYHQTPLPQKDLVSSTL